VIRKNQERYMRSAWAQIGDVLTVNHKIRRAQLAIKAAFSAYTKSTLTLAPERITALAAPILAKVIGTSKTLASMVKASRVPTAAISAALRKQLRPRGLFAKRMLAVDARVSGVGTVISGLSAGTQTAAPVRLPPGGAIVNAVDLTLAPLRVGPVIHPLPPPVVILAESINVGPIGKLLPIGKVPARPIFVYSGPGTQGNLPVQLVPRPPPPIVKGDNPAANDLRRAMLPFIDRLSVHVEPTPPKPALAVDSVQQKAVAALEPHGAFARRYAGQWRVNGVDVLTYSNGRYNQGAPGTGASAGVVREVMNYPDIKDAMCSPLEALSTEYLVPNLKLIPNNTISLMQTNQPFIESYLVGLNHEFARELLWREYPTDQQGSYFRQFWDVSNYVDLDDRSPKDLAEFLKDIPPLTEWAKNSALGSHPHRVTQGGQSQVVLVIRGALLKRYPNAFIYAQKAAWGTGPRENRLIMSDETGELFASTPKDPRLRFPLYQAQVSPDLTFIGFDLTLDEVRGDSRLAETAAARAMVGDNIGWFFVLQEAVGEPRFGMDVAAPTAPSPLKWDNLAWTNLDLSGGQSVDVTKAFLTAPAGSDNGVAWGANAADQAFILYQEPVMVGVHGRTMLKNLNPPA
jgi:hypothetical protein